MFGLKSALSRKDRSAGPTGNGVMFLHCTETGWRWRIVNPQDEGPPIEKAATHSLTLHNNETWIDAAFRQAGESFGQAESTLVERIHILTDDPAIHYCDTRGKIFKTATRNSPVVLRTYGAQQLNSRKVTFGFADFGHTAAGVREAGVVAFADASRAGGCLSRLDKLSTRVAALVPVADLIARRAEELGEGPYGALYVGGHTTHVLAGDPAHGIIVHRVFPVGSITLVEKMAEGSGIAVEEAARSMAARDILAEVKLVDLSGTNADISRSTSDRILGPMLRQLVQDILETFDYFQCQCISRTPQQIEIFGDFQQVAGLEGFLANALPFELVRSVELFDLFCRQAGRRRLNVLEQPGSDLQIGHVPHGFRDQRLVPLSQITAEHSKAEPATARRRQSGGARGGQIARRGPGQAAGSGGRSRLTDLIARLSGGRDPGPATEPLEEASPAKDRQYFMLFGLLAGLLLLVAWQKYDRQAILAATEGSNLVKKIEENSRLHQTVGEGGRGSARQSSDKVLWTEKFLAIGRHLNEHMWLTDVYLTTERRQVKGAEVLSKKLVLEGAVLPSTEGHIKEIAGFIRRLQDDGSQFMSDFREIKFHGSALDQAESDPIIRFSIDAWYDENKRLQSRQEARPSEGALGDMQQKVREREEKLNSFGGAR